MKKIIIVIDSLARELLPFLKLKNELEKKNFKIYFCNKYNFKYLYNFIKPEIIIVGQLFKTPGLREAQKFSHIYYLRAESLSGLMDQLVALYKGTSEVEPDFFCCWGLKEFNFIKKKIKNVNFILSGHPINEINFKSFKRKKNKIIGIATTLRNITSISNYNLISSLINLKKNKDFMNRNPFLKKNTDVSYLYAYEINFLSKLIEILYKFKDKCKIIIRPHPLENIKIYQSLKKLSKNIEIDNSINFETYLNKINILMSYKSSLQIYAYKNKIKVINLEKFLNKDNLSKLESKTMNMPFDKFFVKPTNYDVLLSEIKRPFKKIKKCDEFISNFFYSKERCSDILSQSFNNLINKNKGNIKINLYPLKLTKIIIFFTPLFLRHHMRDILRYLNHFFFKNDEEINHTYSLVNSFKIKKIINISKNIL
jgi:surface carbohydrate biosynthesis protein